MVKKLAAFAAGVSMLAMATILPVMAQTSGSQSPDVNVDVNDYLTFAIANPAADCTAAADGDCPFGAGAAASQLTSSGNNAFDISGDASGTIQGVFTQLATTTNATGGYNVTAYAVNTDTRTQSLLVSGGTPGTAADQITDSVTRLPTAQAANVALNTSTATGLAFRLTSANTSAIIREADEITQWGANDAGGALWAAFPLGSGAAQVAYDTTTFSPTTTTGYINWFVGVSSTQQTGSYNGTVTFTASVN